ncbi:hypothetical protein Daura_33770 [Dactylosporangium aurantiacum]|uniref:Uncharacterized protein n=1 Tax=Dactylosporangium aurantiacum TaxID=35754 RepID=A0A9Q9MGI7_9ACTN|nr:hypothetical protein [Dactylosporangium aurantiacum]MDG6105164.1 hypothetical protein [Dactylosporangium aurantiacum]UWZ51686.1 hypothetical protein Daura_33770 [Dactylosporangium aurantiacum]
MRIELSLDVFQASDAFSLISIMEGFVRQRHDWIVGPEVLDAALEYLAVHAPTKAQLYTATGQKALVQSTAYTPSSGDRVLLTLSVLDAAADDLSRAAVVVVEDLDSDRDFIHAVATVFGAKRVLHALKRTWLVVEHGGGAGRIPVVAKEKLGQFQHVKRVAAVFDSDRLVPGQRTANHDKAQALEQEGVAVHVLARREAENYVPLKVLRLTPHLPQEVIQRLDLLDSLSAEQRAHFDMKNGFGDPARPPRLDQRQHALYSNLSWQTKLALRGRLNGLLSSLARHCEHLTEDDFAQLGSEVPAELRALLAKIESVV